MVANLLSNPGTSGLPAPWLEHAPLPIAMLEGALHLVSYINPAFCRLVGQARDDLLGKQFREILPDSAACQGLLDRVYRTGKPESHTGQAIPKRASVLPSYAMWPVMVEERTVGVMIQAIETVPSRETTVALNEALMLGSLHQHELTAAADRLNLLLQAEIAVREQAERDARMMTMELSHRIKNNLQIFVNLIAREAARAAPACVPGYITMQTRIEAVADLYDLISQSGRPQTVSVDAYLEDIARHLSASVLRDNADIEIVVRPGSLDIDSDRATPFGLLVNELATNAIKHAFSHGKGRITLGAQQIDSQIELIVADNGVGIQPIVLSKNPGKHGSDYVAIFVRQLGGTMTLSTAEGTGTIARIRFPLLVAQ